MIHCSQVHKETVTEIPNAFPHRNNLEMDIYGTEGIPEKDRLERERNKGAGMFLLELKLSITADNRLIITIWTLSLHSHNHRCIRDTFFICTLLSRY